MSRDQKEPKLFVDNVETVLAHFRGITETVVADLVDLRNTHERYLDRFKQAINAMHEVGVYPENEELLNNIRQLSVDIQFYAHSIHCVISNMGYFGEKSRDERVGNLQKYRELLEDLEVKRQNNNKELGRTEEAGK